MTPVPSLNFFLGQTISDFFPGDTFTGEFAKIIQTNKKHYCALLLGLGEADEKT